MVFVVTIHDVNKKGQNFSMIANHFIRILNEANGDKFCRYNLDSSFASCDILEIGHVYRSSNDLEFGTMQKNILMD